ncbi:hypothetical protein P8452_27256 [Trifolium repens]|jgi:hypothetical protein|nr:hypothetical protein P8452_27215 [Trifolium repens]WJX39736.1 hypothetical protein P8452_27256 [Trifolium repens]
MQPIPKTQHDALDKKNSTWWRVLNMVLRVSKEGGIGWFEENLSIVVGDGANTKFWLDPWVFGENLRSQFSRLFDISLDKEKYVAEMISDCMELEEESL